MDLKTVIKTETVECSFSTNDLSINQKRKRRKLRRLAQKSALNTKSRGKCKWILIFTGIITLTAALLMGRYLMQNSINATLVLKEFLKNYRNQYIQIIHGKQNYCDQNQQVDTHALFERVKKYRILHQEKALQQIQLALRNDSDFNAIALVGSVGVGKSLFMLSMLENFQWQENIHTYAWNAYVKEESEKLQFVRIIIENLSECGQNLIVIENLRPCDADVVAVVNDLVKQSIKKQKKRIILFYVFNLNTMLPMAEYDEERRSLQNLTDCNVINFQTFTKIELMDCIEREVDLENLTIDVQHVDEIVETIDPFKSGCKNVNSKVLMFGKRKTIL